MTIKLNIPNKQLYEKILWFLNHFKNDGLEIIIDEKDTTLSSIRNRRLEQFEQIINHKSKNSIKVDKNTILHPHNELSNDIS